MSGRVLRWGRSSYETEEDLARERADAVSLGFQWSLETGKTPDLTGVDALVVVSGVRVSRSILEDFPGQLVVATTSGYDHVDVDACRELGKILVRCPEARRDAVVEQAVSQLGGLMRQFPALQAAASKGDWARAELPRLAPRAIQGSTVVVIGLGVIGTRMMAVLRDWGAEVIGVDPLFSDVVLEDALPRADAVTLHCSLTSSSRNLLSRERLGLLRAHAVVVNTARGDVLDLKAVVEAVKSQRLRGLAVDVFPEEPWPQLAEMASVPGVWLTPHSAGFVADLGKRVAREVRAALGAWKRGEVLSHRVA